MLTIIISIITQVCDKLAAFKIIYLKSNLNNHFNIFKQNSRIYYEYI